MHGAGAAAQPQYKLSSIAEHYTTFRLCSRAVILTPSSCLSLQFSLTGVYLCSAISAVRWALLHYSVLPAVISCTRVFEGEVLANTCVIISVPGSLSPVLHPGLLLLAAIGKVLQTNKSQLCLLQV